MGAGNSKDNGQAENPGLIGKLGGIPRAAAITEGRRAKGGQPKLPPGAIKSQPEDWAFIEVTLHCLCTDACISAMQLHAKQSGCIESCQTKQRTIKHVLSCTY